MTIKSRNDLAKDLNLQNAEVEAFNALADFFHSEQLEVGSPECCYRSECGNYEEYEWSIANESGYIGSLQFGSHHRCSGKKFYFYPNDGLDYTYELIECVPEVSKAYTWTEEQVRSLLYSPSDARSECRTY